MLRTHNIWRVNKYLNMMDVKYEDETREEHTQAT